MLTAGILSAPGEARAAGGGGDAPTSEYSLARKALAVDPKHRGANEYIGELYLETGQLDKAEKGIQ